MAPVNIFLSYSHKNGDMRDELETHLAMLKREGVINLWHDNRITPGKKLDPEIQKNLESADVFAFLVSPYFLDSNYCYDTELAYAEKRASEKTGVIVSIILDPCEWDKTPLAAYKALPKDGRPISKWPNFHEAFHDVATGIRIVVEDLLQTSVNPNGKAEPNKPAKPTEPKKPKPSLPRSSNLRLKREFNDLEKRDFLIEAFDYIGKSFQGSLLALEERNKEIQTRIRWPGSNTFEAEIYQNGTLKSQCRVWLSKDLLGSSPGIAYFRGDLGFHGTNSYHQLLHVDDDGYILFLGSLLSGISRTEDQKLSPQGGAELLWGMFIEPLQ